MKALLQKRDKIFYLAGLLFLVGCAARLVALTSLPNGLNQDEAYAGYNAWCILHYGVDSAGYRNPVYLNAWGSVSYTHLIGVHGVVVVLGGDGERPRFQTAHRVVAPVVAAL